MDPESSVNGEKVESSPEQSSSVSSTEEKVMSKSGPKSWKVTHGLSPEDAITTTQSDESTQSNQPGTSKNLLEIPKEKPTAASDSGSGQSKVDRKRPSKRKDTPVKKTKCQRDIPQTEKRSYAAMSTAKACRNPPSKYNHYQYSQQDGAFIPKQLRLEYERQCPHVQVNINEEPTDIGDMTTESGTSDSDDSDSDSDIQIVEEKVKQPEQPEHPIQ